MKTWKKALARIAALGLTLSLAIGVGMTGALADNTVINSTTTTGTVTVTGSVADVGATVKLYKIIDVNMDTTAVQPKDPVYTWVDAVATWLESHVTYSSYITAADNAVTDAYKGLTAGELNTFFEDLSAAIADSSIDTSAIATNSVETTGSVEFANLSMGQYLVVANDPENVVVYNPASANLYPQWGDHDADLPDGGAMTPDVWYLADATVVLKSSGSVTKVADKTNVNIGDTVTYTVTAPIPAYPDDNDAKYKAFNIGDAMASGLKWDGTVSVYWSEDGTAQIADDYKVEGCYSMAEDVAFGQIAPGQTTNFEVQFVYDTLTANYPQANYIHVIYTATVTDDTFVATNGAFVNGVNTAYLGVNTNPYDVSSYYLTTDTETVYTYGITVTKVDADTNATLPGAQFELYRVDESGIETVKTKVAFTESAGVFTHVTTGGSTVLTTNDDGQIELRGLAYGKYELVEIKAPNGYQLPKDADAVITIVLTDNTEADGTLDVGTATGTMVVGGTTTTLTGNVLSFQVKNETPDFQLPVTGGAGTVAFTAGGLVIMACGAGLVLFAVKKRKTEE